MAHIPILTINLLDIKIPNEVKLFSNFLNGAKDLAREHQALFDAEEIAIDIFHNKKTAYSSIQFSRYQKAASFTAIGEKEVKALEIWFALFKKTAEIPLQNFQKITETYTPIIENTNLFYYQVEQLLIKNEIAQELDAMKNDLAKKERLKNYLVGNIKRFLTDLEALNPDDFISVEINKFYKKHRHPTYHGGTLRAYDIRFKTNIWLPQTLRLGQATALGYGLVHHK